jgi:hypothetical protein
MNTNTGINKYSLYLNNKNILINNSIYDEYILRFKEKNNFKPSSGIVALNFILNTNEYSKITLVGFDNYQKNTQIYYYKPELINPQLRYYFDRGDMKHDGTINDNEAFQHPPEKTYNYLIDTIKKNQHIKFNFITNMKFNNYFPNLIIE